MTERQANLKIGNELRLLQVPSETVIVLISINISDDS